MTPIDDNYLSPEQVAARLNVSVVTLRRMRSRGEAPPSVRVGHMIRFPKAGVEAWIKTITAFGREFTNGLVDLAQSWPIITQEQANDRRNTRLVFAIVRHDDGCKTLETNNELDCTCSPDVEYREQPGEILEERAQPLRVQVAKSRQENERSIYTITAISPIKKTPGKPQGNNR